MHKFHTPALAAFATGEPIRPIGFRRDGRAIFPIAGGAEDAADADKGADSDSGKDKGAEYKAPATQADLDRIVGERLAREREATKARYADYDDLKKDAEAHRAALEAAKSDAEKAIDAARTEGEKAATERSNQRIIKAEARTLAATAKFRDPADAVAFLDLSKVTVNENGEVDEKAISDQLKSLAESKPYLVDDGKKPAPKPDRAQGGSSSKGGKLSGLSGDELYDRLHPKTA